MSGYIVKIIEFKDQPCVPIPKPLMKKLGWKEGDHVDVKHDKKRDCITLKKV